jgi:shikimate kinase
MTMNLILCGLPLCGKSHYGKLAAEHLNCSFIDTDRWIETSYEAASGNFLTCRELFLQEGEAAFRQREKQVIESLQNQKKAIIALGGGSLMDPENAHFLKSIGILIYLKVEIAVLFERLHRKEQLPAYLNPQFPEKSFAKMARRRIKIYNTYADYIVDTTLMAEEEVIDFLLMLDKKKSIE